MLYRRMVDEEEGVDTLVHCRLIVLREAQSGPAGQELPRRLVAPAKWWQLIVSGLQTQVVEAKSRVLGIT